MRRLFPVALLLALAFPPLVVAMPIRPADNSIETIMAMVREKHAPDDFTAYFDIKTEWKGSVLYLSGHSDNLDAVAELRAAVMNAHIPNNDTIEIVPQRNDLNEKIWALVTAPETRALPDDRWGYPLSIPAGTPVQRLLALEDNVSLVRLPDSHIVKLAEKDLRLATETEIFIWNRRDKLAVLKNGTPFHKTADLSGEPLLTLPEGALLRLDVRHEKTYEAALPNNTRGFIAKEAVREHTPFQVKEETRRRDTGTRFTADLASTARNLVKTFSHPTDEPTVGMAFLTSLMAQHDLILPADAGLLSRAFPKVKHGRHGDQLKAGDLLLFKNDRGIETIAFVTAPGRFVTTGFTDGRLGTQATRKLGRLVVALRPDYGFLNDPCLTSTRSNPFYQTPAVKLVPCRNRADLELIR